MRLFVTSIPAVDAESAGNVPAEVLLDFVPIPDVEICGCFWLDGLMVMVVSESGCDEGFVKPRLEVFETLTAPCLVR